MWSHHEKLVIIDQDIAFVGGVDLSLGRWDTSEYKMCDDGPDAEKLWLGKDYQNPRIKDYVNVQDAFEENPMTGVARDSVPRMPRRDIHMRVFGQTALDVAWHFIQRWNYTRHANKSKEQVDPLVISGSAAAQMAKNDDEELGGSQSKPVSGAANKTGAPSPSKDRILTKSSSCTGLSLASAAPPAASLVDRSWERKPSILGDAIELPVAADAVDAAADVDIGLSPSLSLIRGLFRTSDSNNSNKSVGGGGEDDDDNAGIDDASFASAADTIMAFNVGDLNNANDSSDASGSSFSSLRRSAPAKSDGPTNFLGAHEGGIVNQEVQDSDLVYLTEAVVNDASLNRRTSYMNMIQVSARNLAEETRLTRASSLRNLRRAVLEEDEEGEEESSCEKYEESVSFTTDEKNGEGGDRKGGGKGGGGEGTQGQDGRGGRTPKNSSSGNKLSKRQSSRGVQGALRTGDVDYVNVLGQQYKPTSCNMSGIYATRCHLLRSCGKWSSGLLDDEKGIQDTYKHVIDSAQHYIYIENQFFISNSDVVEEKATHRVEGMRGGGPRVPHSTSSSTPQNQRAVKNSLCQSIFARIVKAARQGATFRVFILIPLLPAMDSPVKGGPLSSIAGVMYWQFKTICRGGNSLIEKLVKEGIDPHEYLKFVGLRTHDKMKNGYQTEQVYIHSKLMIIDDHTTIIGSANFNDRSMMGSKDTEICILTEDTQMEESRMNGNTFQAGKFSKSLRMQCWAEMCGLDLTMPSDYALISDPTHDDTWSFMLDLAKSNTKKYEMVFKDLVPSDRIKKAEDIKGSDGSSSGIVSGTVSGNEFGRRVSMSAALRTDENLAYDSNPPGAKLMKSSSNRAAEEIPSALAGNLKALEALNGKGGIGVGGAGGNKRSHQNLELLKSVQGLVVDWPLEFMSTEFEHLHPSALPGEIFK